MPSILGVVELCAVESLAGALGPWGLNKESVSPDRRHMFDADAPPPDADAVLRELDLAKANRVVRMLNGQGYAVIRDFLPPAEHERVLQGLVASAKAYLVGRARHVAARVDEEVVELADGGAVGVVAEAAPERAPAEVALVRVAPVGLREPLAALERAPGREAAARAARHKTNRARRHAATAAKDAAADQTRPAGVGKELGPPRLAARADRRPTPAAVAAALA